MALYIAVCDDNAADRKQIERVLDREKSSQTLKGNIIYFDSFGSKDSLMKTPNRYNLFLISMAADSELNGLDIAGEIKQSGIDALIVLMYKPGQIYEPLPSDLTIKNKPLTSTDISELVELAEVHAQNKTPIIEIRCKDSTIFATPDEFICAVSAKNGFGTEIYLTDNRKYFSTDTIEQFTLWMHSFPEMVRCSNSYINSKHVRSLSGFHLSLSNGIRLRIKPTERSKFRSI